LSGFSFIPDISANGATSFCNGSSVVLMSTAVAGNQWYKDGVTINGAIGAAYQATTSGSYTVQATSNGITTSSPAAIVVNVTTTVPTPTITANGSLLTSSATTGNQWYFDGTLIQNATAQTYQPSKSGNYTVQVTSNGCISAFSAAYNYVLTGIIELGNSQFIKIFPNPVQSTLIIQWNISNLRSLSITIRDIYGNLALYRNNITSDGTINLSGLATGTYFVEMYGADQKRLGTMKILKVN
jgi:hypothetical protein